ncbi:MAG: electron transfer flavoprotein subunit beta/FixA family protein [Ignavibacteria bacterium]|nr:electron transfer flavoprotein subunit beta/FixA family protein [Ignavibacteria bacterium]
MKIGVCIDKVPETESELIISEDNTSLSFTGKYIINPYDEYAVEEAVRTKEKLGGEICVISVGDEQNKEIIRKALAIGCDYAVLLKTDDRIDSLSVAKMLASEIKKRNFDLVFFGKQKVDFDSAVTGKIVADILDFNYLPPAVKLDITQKTICAEIQTDNGVMSLETSSPAIITTQKGLNEPRYASLKGIMNAKKIPIEEIAADSAKSFCDISSYKISSEKKVCKILNYSKDSVKELADFLKNESKDF